MGTRGRGTAAAAAGARRRGRWRGVVGRQQVVGHRCLTSRPLRPALPTPRRPPTRALHPRGTLGLAHTLVHNCRLAMLPRGGRPCRGSMGVGTRVGEVVGRRTVGEVTGGAPCCPPTLLPPPWVPTKVGTPTTPTLPRPNPTLLPCLHRHHTAPMAASRPRLELLRPATPTPIPILEVAAVVGGLPCHHPPRPSPRTKAPGLVACLAPTARPPHTPCTTASVVVGAGALVGLGEWGALCHPALPSCPPPASTPDRLVKGMGVVKGWP